MWKYFDMLFKLNKSNLAIKKAIMQACIVFVILMTSFVFGRFDLGLTAVLGSFSNIYVINGSYPSRIRKVIVVTLMLSLSLMLGTLTITVPFLYALVLGLIGMIAHFVLKAFQIPGPSSLFFVLTYSIASIMPIMPEEVWNRGLLILCGGVISTLAVIIDAVFNHKKPEKESVLNIYKKLTYLMEHFSGKNFDDARGETLNAIHSATTTLTTANAFWNKNKDYHKLLQLKSNAEAIWSSCLELSSRGNESIPIEIIDGIKYISERIEGREKASFQQISINKKDEHIDELTELVNTTVALLDDTDVKLNKQINYRKPMYSTIIKDNLSKNSMVLMSSMQYGIILFASVIIAFGIGFERAYWIPMSCCSVLLGSTSQSTIQRALQRTFGTIVGMLVAVIILYFEPNTWEIVILMAILMGTAELLIAFNYTIAVMFITPNVLLMSAAITHHFDTHLVFPRITDVIIGSLIGLIGVLVINRKQASKKLPKTINNTLRIQANLLHTLFSTNKYHQSVIHSKLIRKMQTEIMNTKAMYQAALHETDNNVKQIEYVYPIIFTVEQLAFTIERAYQDGNISALPDQSIGLYLTTYENICKEVEFNISYEIVDLPQIKGIASIRTELMKLQNISRGRIV
ncbi:FUSC family protein [Mammaliicoccus sp. Dog046]|uniref:FUSC family protein n=1 Tax=Mammaliicoccus sp. Dog046 TaxID=3034233 RepID=UPI002B25D3C4|nr:FUSC family protein [Mammaliicoccus sp. Dog046]WQK85323.1 FUSC family protein [Mammaliicoccus sp. Dog046]